MSPVLRSFWSKRCVELRYNRSRKLPHMGFCTRHRCKPPWWGIANVSSSVLMWMYPGCDVFPWPSLLYVWNSFGSVSPLVYTFNVTYRRPLIRSARISFRCQPARLTHSRSRASHTVEVVPKPSLPTTWYLEANTSPMLTG